MSVEHILGATRIFTEILNSKKPMIGHNSFLDLCFYYNQFLGELPQTLREFKQEIKETFPFQLDTKYIAESFLPKKYQNGTSLDSLLNLFSKHIIRTNIDVQLTSEFDKYFSGNFAHEAGYDAYITGIIYLNLKSYILENNIYNSEIEILHEC